MPGIARRLCLTASLGLGAVLEPGCERSESAPLTPVCLVAQVRACDHACGSGVQQCIETDSGLRWSDCWCVVTSADFARSAPGGAGGAAGQEGAGSPGTGAAGRAGSPGFRSSAGRGGGGMAGGPGAASAGNAGLGAAGDTRSENRSAGQGGGL